MFLRINKICWFLFSKLWWPRGTKRRFPVWALKRRRNNKLKHSSTGNSFRITLRKTKLKERVMRKKLIWPRFANYLKTQFSRSWRRTTKKYYKWIIKKNEAPRRRAVHCLRVVTIRKNKKKKRWRISNSKTNLKKRRSGVGSLKILGPLKILSYSGKTLSRCWVSKKKRYMRSA